MLISSAGDPVLIRLAPGADDPAQVDGARFA
jgi:hypothetical protein